MRSETRVMVWTSEAEKKRKNQNGHPQKEVPKTLLTHNPVHTTAIIPWCEAKVGELKCRHCALLHSEKMVWNYQHIWIITTVSISNVLWLSSLTSTTWGLTFVHKPLNALKCSSRRIFGHTKVTKSNFPSLATWWILWKTTISQWPLTHTTKPERYTVPLCLAHLTGNPLVSTGTWRVSAMRKEKKTKSLCLLLYIDLFSYTFTFVSSVTHFSLYFLYFHFHPNQSGWMKPRGGLSLFVGSAPHEVLEFTNIC